MSTKSKKGILIPDNILDNLCCECNKVFLKEDLLKLDSVGLFCINCCNELKEATQDKTDENNNIQVFNKLNKLDFI